VCDATLACRTCGRVVEVLVDKLAIVELAIAQSEGQRAPKHTSLEALAMSLKAGGGNLGTTFSTLTYSDMIAMVGCRAWGCEGCCGGSIVDEKTAQTCFRSGLRNRANGPLRDRTGCSLTKQPTTCILLPCICRILNSSEPGSIRATFCGDTAHLQHILQ
jgi:hypothetical protein